MSDLITRLRSPQTMSNFTCTTDLYEEMNRQRVLAADEIERLRELMRAVVEHFRRDGDGLVDAPGHCHDVPGAWDSDNGALAGKPCAWCALWKEVIAGSKCDE
ncbi:MAG: hypothetical protein H3C27_15715 [Opitutaceae bacterium]|nr:hypothetical protein [Opitutaceae bacterium]